MSRIVGFLNDVSAHWGEMMLRASITGGVVIALLWVVCLLWPGMSPTGRSWLWRAAFAKLVLALCWGLSLGVPLLPSLLPPARQTPPYSVVAPPSRRSLPDTTVSNSIPLPSSPLTLPQTATATERPNQFFSSPPASFSSSSPATKTIVPAPSTLRPTLTLESCLLLCWLLGAGFLSLRALRAWHLTRRWYDQGEPITDSSLTAWLTELCQHFDLDRSPQLRSCPSISTLALTGVRRPTILLSPRFLQEQELKASLPLMLAHELAHHKRRDLAWNWLLLLGQTLFWFHPLVWIGARQWRMAQEVACDELAIQATHIPVAAYGAMLLQSAIKGRSNAPDNLFAVGVGERYTTLHKRLSAMKHFSSNTNHKRALIFCALSAGATLLPWHLATRTASAQDKVQLPVALSEANTPRTKPVKRRQVEVRGVVQDEAGRPVRGAMVSLNRNESGHPRLTDAQGRFSVQVVAPLDGSKLNCQAAIYAPGQTFTIAQLEEGRITTVRLGRGVKIRGQVRDSLGHPLANVPVSLVFVIQKTVSNPSAISDFYLLVPPALTPTLTVRTDLHGVYELPAISSGLTMAIIDINDSRFVRRQFNVLLPSTVPVIPLIAPLQTLRLPAGIAGRVVNAASQPLRGIEVAARRMGATNGDAPFANAVSGRDGTYFLKNLASGTYQVRWHDPNGTVVTQPRLDVKTQTSVITRLPDVAMTSGGLVQGTVTDADSGKPIAGVMVSDAQDARIHIGPSSSTGQQPRGQFQLRMPAGTGRIYISTIPSGYLSPDKGSFGRPIPVDIQEGQVVTLPLQLKKGQTLQGTALDSQGRVPKAALILVAKVLPRWELSGFDGLKFARPDANGRWSIDSLSPGKYRVQVRGDWEIVTAGDKDLEIEVPSPSPLQLQLRHALPPTLMGRAVTPDGRPISGVSIGLNIDAPIGDGSFEGTKEKLVTDGRGIFTRPRLQPDVHLFLKASKVGYRFVSGGTITRYRTAQGRQFRVSDLVLAPANIEELLRGGAPVSGRVIYKGGQPAQVKIRLMASGDFANSLERTVDWRGQNNARLLNRLSATKETSADGRFEIMGLPALPFRMSIVGQRSGWFWPDEWRTQFTVPYAQQQPLKLPDVVLEKGAVVRYGAIDKDTGEELQGNLPLAYLSQSSYGSTSGPTSPDIASDFRFGQETVPAGTFALEVWRNPDGRLPEEVAHLYTAKNRFIRYYDLASPTLEVSVNGGAHQLVGNGRVSFPVTAGQTYQVTYFLHRQRPTNTRD